MLALTLSLWTGVTGFGAPEAGQTLPAGLYPAGIIAVTLPELQNRPLRSGAQNLGCRAILVRQPLLLSAEKLPLMAILLRSADLHFRRHPDGTGGAFTFLTDDPRKAPDRPVPYQTYTLRLVHTDAQLLAESLQRYASGREKNLPEGDTPTLITASSYGNRLVIRYASHERLAHYLRKARDLDRAREDQNSPGLRSYLCKNQVAQNLAEQFRAAWKKAGKEEITIIVQRQANALLFRLPRVGLWSEVKTVLEELDKVRIRR